MAVSSTANRNSGVVIFLMLMRSLIIAPYIDGFALKTIGQHHRDANTSRVGFD